MYEYRLYGVILRRVLTTFDTDCRNIVRGDCVVPYKFMDFRAHDVAWWCDRCQMTPTRPRMPTQRFLQEEIFKNFWTVSPLE